MLRVIIRVAESGAACNVGGPVNITYKTFDIDAPEIERFLTEKNAIYLHSEVTGVEVLK